VFRLGLASADRPTGPYRTVRLPWFDEFGSNIDAHLFVDDGRPYLFFDKVGSTNGVIWGQIFGVELDPTLERALGDPAFVSGASQPWEKPGSRNETNEGAFVFKREGRYYLTYSGNGYRDPDYGIGYETAASPLGPWTKSPDNPVLARDDAAGVSGPGHSSMVLSPDGSETFIVYHAHPDPSQAAGGRTVNIDRVRFQTDGRLEVAGPTRTPQPAPAAAR
jgi:GH43 family beta-xylosidase